MNTEQLAHLEAAYAKLKGIDLFRFKAYFEKTGDISAANLWVGLSELLVNLPFMLLNLLVLLFSMVFDFFSTIDVYNSYKQVAYTVSKDIWLKLNGSGNYNNSAVYLLVALSAFYLFFSFLWSSANFGRKLLHLFSVMIMGLAYFGTVNGTGGGLYLLDGVHTISQTVKHSLTGVSIETGSGEAITSETSLSDLYRVKTSYAAYLYVNTGRLDGTYQDSQTDELKPFDDSKVLGQSGEDGKFKYVKLSERLDYLDKGMGHGGADGKESNRWVSAVGDLMLLKSVFVLAKIIEAVAIGVPLVMVEFFEFMSQTVVLLFIILFPVGLLLSFIPRLQNIMLNLLKTMLSAAAFPGLTGVLTLLVFYIQSVVTAFVGDGFSKIGNQFNLEGPFLLMTTALFSALMQVFVFVAIWKNKAWFFRTLFGSDISRPLNQMGNKMSAALPFNPYKEAMKLPGMAMAGLGFAGGLGTGLMLNATDNWSYMKNKFFSNFNYTADERRTFSDSLEGELYDNPVESNSYQPNQLGYDNTIDGDFTEVVDIPQLAQPAEFNAQSSGQMPGSQPGQPNKSPNQSSSQIDTFREQPQVTTPNHQADGRTSGSQSGQVNQKSSPSVDDYSQSQPDFTQIPDVELTMGQTSGEKVWEEDVQSSADFSGASEYSSSTGQENYQNADSRTADSFKAPYETPPQPKGYEQPNHFQSSASSNQHRTEPSIQDAVFTEKKAPVQVEDQSLTEYEQLRQQFRTKRQKKKESKLQGQLDQYVNPETFYQATGGNSFLKGYRMSMNRDKRIQSNIKRRDRIQRELTRLREGS